MMRSFDELEVEALGMGLRGALILIKIVTDRGSHADSGGQYADYLL
jgi:hypothetical protein